jgi:hypothetical protein
MDRRRLTRAYSFTLLTFALFLVAWIGQFIFQMMEFANEATQHHEAFVWGAFLASFLKSTLENWQSEFLQLCWQAGGLALLLDWGSSQSREGDERLERKINRLLEERGINPREIDQEVVREFDGGGR